MEETGCEVICGALTTPAVKGWVMVNEGITALSFCSHISVDRTRDGDIAQLIERRTGTPLRQVRFLGAARDFSPRVHFRCRLSYGVRTLPCAIACFKLCAHVKDLVDHVRVRWIMETLKHSACTVGWVARLCRSWLSPGKSKPLFPWEKSQRDNTDTRNIKINNNAFSIRVPFKCRTMDLLSGFGFKLRFQ